MQFVTTTDIQAPPAEVFAALSDFAATERLARKRGIEVTRIAGQGQDGPDAAWRIGVDVRGRRWTILSRVETFAPPRHLAVAGRGDGVDLAARFALTPLAPAATRLEVTLEMTPHSLTARLLATSLALVRANLQGRIDAAFQRLGRDIAARATGAGPGA